MNSVANRSNPELTTDVCRAIMSVLRKHNNTMKELVYSLLLLTAVLPVTGAAEPWLADCVRLAESLITKDDTLTRNQQMDKSRAGDYLGREAWQREVPELLRQVAAGGDVSLRSPSGFTALQAACMAGDVALAQALIDAGADVNARPERWEDMGYPGYTPLGMLVSFEHRTAEEDRLRLAKAMLDKGADPDAATITRIWDIAEHNVPFELTDSDDMRRLLLRYGNQDLGKRTEKWWIGWRFYSAGLIRDLLEGGVHPDSHVGEKGSNLMLVLMLKQPNDPSLTELALSKGAKPRLGGRGRHYHSDYLFHLRVDSQVHPESAVEIVRLLLDAGADINALNHSGNSLRIHFGSIDSAAARAVGELLRSRGAKLHPDAK